MIYCYVASVLPVWVLLQPRDYINSHQLVVALGLLILGLTVASATGQADLIAAAPAYVPAADRPIDAPPLWPFLFITIACGAVSGFHCLVCSGTSSKQMASETDAQYVGYGAMLLEGRIGRGRHPGLLRRSGDGRARRQRPGSGSPVAQPGKSRYQAKIVTTIDPQTGEQ